MMTGFIVGITVGVLLRPMWNAAQWWYYYRQNTAVPMDADRISRIANGKL